MKYSLKLLGLGFFITAMVMAGENQVYAEPAAGSDDSIEAADTGAGLEALDDSSKDGESTSQSSLEDEIEAAETGQDLRITYLCYSIPSKMFYAFTVPNASVHVSIPSTGGQAIIQADGSGHFNIVDKFTPGMEVVFVVHDELGNAGEAMTYTIPTQETADRLLIREVSFSHATKQLTGKTAPNATVKVTTSGKEPGQPGGRGIYSADAQGNFEITENFKAGLDIYISVTVDEVTGEEFKYTIPEEVLNSATESSSTDLTNKKTQEKKGFPKTGETKSLVFISAGIILVLGAGYIIVKRKFAGRR